MKVIGVNYEGTEWRIVAAKSMKEAAKHFNLPLHYVRENGCETGNAEECDLALREIGVVWSQSYKRGSSWVRVIV